MPSRPTDDVFVLGDQEVFDLVRYWMAVTVSLGTSTSSRLRPRIRRADAVG